MKESEINFKIQLDNEKVPEKIAWRADDQEEEGYNETKSMSISLWDHLNKNTLRIDLWTKDMPVDEMKRFYIDTIGGMAQSVLNSTGDEYMAGQLNEVCERLVDHLKKESEKS